MIVMRAASTVGRIFQIPPETSHQLLYSMFISGYKVVGKTEEYCGALKYDGVQWRFGLHRNGWIRILCNKFRQGPKGRCDYRECRLFICKMCDHKMFIAVSLPLLFLLSLWGKLLELRLKHSSRPNGVNVVQKSRIYYLILTFFHFYFF